MIVGILLAAGRGSRFGGQKLLARMPNLPNSPMVVEASAANLLRAVGSVIAVTRREEKLMRVLDDCGCRIVVNERADEGMGVSLAAGIAASEDASGWIVALADMPYIQSGTIVRVRDALLAGAPLAIPVRGGARGHPVGFGREFRDALLALQGDTGAKALVADHLHCATLIEVDDLGITADIDTQADLQAVSLPVPANDQSRG
jgi:molybdenum cofactor cytidylyltransferase